MKVLNEELAKKIYESLPNTKTGPTCRHMQILSKKQIERCSESLRRTKALFCEYGEDIDVTQPGVKAKTLFIIDHLSFDNKGNLVGRVTPYGDLQKIGEQWISQSVQTRRGEPAPIFSFSPCFVVNNRNWRYILKLQAALTPPYWVTGRTN